MPKRITLSADTPIRDIQKLTTYELWTGPDEGLRICWESGRIKAQEVPELAAKAIRNELPELCWERGTPYYLAYWQGLRGDDLSVDIDEEFELVCSQSKRTFAFVRDYTTRQKRQKNLILLEIKSPRIQICKVSKIAHERFSRY